DHVEGSERRGILSTRLLQHALSRSLENKRAADTIAVDEQPLGAPLCASLRARARPCAELARALHGDVAENRRMYDLVDEPHLHCLTRPDIAAAENHVERARQTDEARQSLRAASAGNQSKLNLRQAEDGLWMLGRDAPRTGERGLQATAEARAVDCGNDGHAQSLEPGQHFLTRVTRLLGFFCSFELEKLLDVRASDEVVGLTRDEHRRTDRGIAFEL